MRAVASLEVQSLVDALVDALRKEVLSGELPPGATVTEHELASRWDVARPTAKAAIDRVVQSGILRRSANRSARVPLLSPADISDLYLSRIVFERAVVRSLAASRSLPEAATAALSALRDAIVTDSVLDSAAGDIGFHRALVEESGSPRLIRMFDTVAEEAHLCMAQEQRVSGVSGESSYSEHLAIADAVQAGDPDLAAKLMVDHLCAAAERLLGIPLALEAWLA
jgi:DNA-binding GntR family transcriptional regulator